MTVEEAVIRILSYQLGIPRSTDILNKNVYELGADSLDFVELIMMIEDVMSCEIDDITAEIYQMSQYLHWLTTSVLLQRESMRV